MPPVKPSAGTMRSLERAIDVLEVLDESRQSLRLSDIARRVELPVATVQRILTVLEARGRVERDATGYRPGLNLIFGSHAYLSGNPLLVAARPVLQDLADETRLTASLFRRADWSRVALVRIPGSRPLRYELPIGERLPLHLGAGKALVAHLPAAELDDFLDRLGEHKRADGTTVDRAGFLRDLAEIRDRGYSVAASEREPGMASVAAPVLDPDGTARATVQVSGHQEDLPADRLEQLGAEVRRAAHAIARRAC
ncbi:IclR family transcriptional regulator [Saccharopolyspora gregorii]|uniref:IclR family transcriptional regulator C-terminal domain-containing protein n=1 Tax=Saccharopolyspora gregorii TaxID=33914 RepID=A0ABP6RQ56_9PSEU